MHTFSHKICPDEQSNPLLLDDEDELLELDELLDELGKEGIQSGVLQR